MRDLITELATSAAYPHPVETVEVIETHISWVLLTGRFAYKIKKPVNFGFVDFSTLERRRRDCDREFALNSAISRDVYLGVVPIRTTTDGHPEVDSAEGEIIEYAVKMRQFDQSALFSARLASGALDVREIEALADRVAGVHRDAERAAPGTAWGDVDQISYWNEENLGQIDQRVNEPAMRARVNDLSVRMRHAFDHLREVFLTRRDEGSIRDCHGDLHLGNILWIKERVELFDRVEFNESLRWIDVINDVSFTAMDLCHEQHGDLAWRFLNRYFEQTGDYAGARVLRFYMAYRSLVRAKVALLSGPDSASTDGVFKPGFFSHLELAERLLEPSPAMLMITCGLSGSGKTTRALDEAARIGALVVHTDVERKRLFGIGPREKSGSGINEGIYTAEASARVYGHVARLARWVMLAGYPVIVDGAFLRRADRDRFRVLAEEFKASFDILYCQAAPSELRRRIRSRLAAGAVSEATIDVLEYQLAHAELPDQQELQGVDD